MCGQLLVLKYVQNKDVFMRYHKAHLTRRLILDSSADNEKEENMVEWLRVTDSIICRIARAVNKDVCGILLGSHLSAIEHHLPYELTCYLAQVNMTHFHPEGVYSFLWEPMSEMQSIPCRMGLLSATCHRHR